MAYVKSMQILLTQFTTINAEIMSTCTCKTTTIPVWGTYFWFQTKNPLFDDQLDYSIVQQQREDTFLAQEWSGHVSGTSSQHE